MIDLMVSLLAISSCSGLNFCIVSWYGLGKINKQHLIFRVRTPQSPAKENRKEKKGKENYPGWQSTRFSHPIRGRHYSILFPI
jgi:hypothetical protein